MTENIIYTVVIKKIIEESEDVKTFIFNLKSKLKDKYINPKPGQFVMIWVPGVDEVPMSISGCDEEGNWSVTVRNIGESTNALHRLKIGDYIGIRGPLGNFFKIPEDKSKRIILVGGRIGTSPLKFLATTMDKLKIPFDLIEATQTSSDIIFIEDFNSFESDTSNVIYCVERNEMRGRMSSKVRTIKIPDDIGRAHESFEKLIKNYIKKGELNFIAFACGPERMIFEIFKICDKYNIELQASLERIMRCGCGLCGLCVLDPLGLLVCKDGPVFKLNELKKMNDFGKFKRDFTGKKINIE